jgi:hypothetical protein
MELAMTKREWQGLTDKEIELIDEIVDTDLLFRNFSGADYIHEFAHAIEKALKEKNYVSND